MPGAFYDKIAWIQSEMAAAVASLFEHQPVCHTEARQELGQLLSTTFLAGEGLQRRTSPLLINIVNIFLWEVKQQHTSDP